MNLRFIKSASQLYRIYPPLISIYFFVPETKKSLSLCVRATYRVFRQETDLWESCRNPETRVTDETDGILAPFPNLRKSTNNHAWCLNSPN